MRTKQVGKKARNRYSAELKKQALGRVEKDAVALAAGDLGLSASQLYAWRQKQRLERLTTEEEKLQRGRVGAPDAGGGAAA